MMSESLAPVDPHDAVDRVLTLLRSAPDSQFEPLMLIARELLGTPIAAINLIQGDRLWSKATAGIDRLEMPRTESLCHQVVLDDAPLTVDDCTQDDRFAALGLVTEGGLRFYAGVPLHTVDPETGQRHAIGAMCVGDVQPRTLDTDKADALRALGDLAETVIATQLSVDTAVGLAAVANDQARELARQERLFHHAERMARIGSWRLVLPANEIHWSPGIRTIHELPIDALLPLDEAMGFYPPHARAVVNATLARAVERGGPFDFEVDFVTATGRHRRVRSIGEAECNAAGTVVALTGVFQDVTDRHLLEQQLRRSASTDPLTGIANRAAFDAELARDIAFAVEGGGACVLIVIDLDHFKTINDTYGHLAGDDVLRAIAERLHAPYLDNAFAARLGGDEFAVILRIRSDCDAAETLAARLAADLAQPVESDGRMLAVSATLGHAAIGGSVTTARDLLQAADAALYAAKRARPEVSAARAVSR